MQICGFTLYVDDTTALKKRNNVQTLHVDVKTTVDEIACWFLNNSLLLNKEKINI